jgi:hypothetical protein
MKGLLIRDELRWHDHWSSEIGRRLAVRDSTKDLYIFDDRTSREDILTVLKEVPEDLYQLFDIEEAPEADCDYMADSGRCYRKQH